VLAGAAGWYASVLTFRGPALVLFGLGAWFTYVKIRNGYSLKRARFHLLITFLLSIIVACIVYLLTK
jgi:K+-sensing histidine kinase KdpD